MRFRLCITALLCLHSMVLAQSVNDPSLQVQAVVSGMEGPTGIAFMPSGDAFVIQKDSGKVQLVHDGTLGSTVLDLKVANDSERGLLGIALHPDFNSNGLVYLYYTAARSDGGDPIANRIDRFHWNGSSLSFDRRIKSLPGGPGPNHDGGRILFGPDGKLYSITGNLNREERTENFETSHTITRAGAILRLNDDGSSPQDNPFYSASNVHTSRAAVNDMFAYGIRNGFGLTFDSKTGQLWDTENGVNTYDEINRITAGFNSGWQDIMGPRSRHGGTTGTLVKLGVKAHYSDPLFSWKKAVAPTALSFNHTDALGQAHGGGLFVGDVEGRLYEFGLSHAHKDLALSGGVTDRVADNNAEVSSLVIGHGFGIVTDILPRDDGMYVLSLTNGTLYKISEVAAGAQLLRNELLSTAIAPEPSSLFLAALFGLCLPARRRAPTR